MPIRLFGGRENDKGRTCPACEQNVAAAATFCPSCYMVFRPEGAADLREHLQGGRIPSDVYLLRKMQVEVPETGPVVREPARASVSPLPTPGGPVSPEPDQPPESPVAAQASPPESSVPVAVPPAETPDANGPVQSLISPDTSLLNPLPPGEAPVMPRSPVPAGRRSNDNKEYQLSFFKNLLKVFGSIVSVLSGFLPGALYLPRLAPLFPAIPGAARRCALAPLFAANA